MTAMTRPKTHTEKYTWCADGTEVRETLATVAVCEGGLNACNTPGDFPIQPLCVCVCVCVP